MIRVAVCDDEEKIAGEMEKLLLDICNREVPPHAKCDGQQSLTPEAFRGLMGKVERMVDLVGKTLIK